MLLEPLTIKSNGFLSTEALLSVGVFSLLVTVFIGVLIHGQESTMMIGNRGRAQFLAEEGLEAVRAIRNTNYNDVAAGTHGVSSTSTGWTFSGTSDTTDSFVRTISVAAIDAQRSAVTSTVTWQQNAQRVGSVSLSTRLTNWIAAAAGAWATPALVASANASGSSDGVKVAITPNGTHAILIRSGGTPNLLIYDVSTPAAPALVGTLTVTDTLTALTISGNFVYLTSVGNNTEFQVVDISNPATPMLVGTHNISGNANARSIVIVDTVAYVVRDSSSAAEFVSVDISNPAAPSVLGSVDLGADAKDIVVLGTTAFVASASNSEELQVISVAVPAVPVQIGSYNANGLTDATAVAGFGTTVFLAQDGDLYVLNVATPTAPVKLGSISLGGKINDITIGPNNTQVFIGTNDGSQEFVVLDISSLASPAVFGTFNLSGPANLNGVSYSQLFDRVFGAYAGNEQEFVVFAPL